VDEHPQGSAFIGNFYSPVFVLYTVRINIKYSIFPLKMYLRILRLSQNKPQHFVVAIN
jgi:hypothetical protein